MSDKSSYAKLEKHFVHELRQGLNHSENITDVMNCFSHIAGSFLRKAFENRIDILDSDLILTPENSKKFQYSNRVLQQEEFVDGISNSDMDNIISKFAIVAEHRYVHLGKHLEKSELKIRARRNTK